MRSVTPGSHEPCCHEAATSKEKGHATRPACSVCHLSIPCRRGDGPAGTFLDLQVAWRMDLRSGTHLWQLVMGSNPMGATLVADLTEEQRANVCQVLDRMLRERSGGRPGATLTTDVNVATATK